MSATVCVYCLLLFFVYWDYIIVHLAEWQALQQLEYLFNLAVSVDAKNLAVEKLKAHNKCRRGALPRHQTLARGGRRSTRSDRRARRHHPGRPHGGGRP